VDAREQASLVVRPRSGRAPFGAYLARWIEAGVAAHRGLREVPDGAAALVLVPEYLRAGAPTVLADLARADWKETVVAVVGYGGRTRGRFAVDDARDVLDAAGAHVLEAALGVDSSRVRTEGFDPADVLLRDLLFDRLAEEAVRGALRAREH
jgi:NAD(P)H-dependent FMN reductase